MEQAPIKSAQLVEKSKAGRPSKTQEQQLEGDMRREVEIKRGLSPIVLITKESSMSNGHWLLKAFKTIGLALILGASLTACGAGKSSWKEEVQLSDGKVIVVERDAIYVIGGAEWASNSSGSKIDEYRIRFEYPSESSQIVEWHSVKKSPRTYPEIPLVLDMLATEPIIFSLVAISNGCEVYSKYVYRNGVWAEEKLPQPFEQRATNLLFASKKDLPTLLKLADKNKRNDDIGHRRALYQVGPNLKVCG
ncbi:MAG TPA: hypothetical protein VK967_04985 [Methylotenera sp.]|nr:hypothetical protein [Methylotenera sp.]